MTPLHLLTILLLLITFTSSSSSATPAAPPTQPSHTLPTLFSRPLSSSSPSTLLTPHTSPRASHTDDPISDLFSDLFDDDDDGDADDEDVDQLTTFYTAHAQCRRCLRDNQLFAQPCPSSSDDDDDGDDRNCCGAQCSLPQWQPLQAMQWCRTTVGADWQGQCVDALASCPSPLNTSTPFPSPLTSPSSCASDPPPSKLSCVLCTLDSYSWLSTQSALTSGDDYAGQCVAAVTPSTPVQAYGVVVVEMDGCPSFVKEARDPAGRFRVLSFMLLFFLVATAMATCWGVRRCWQWRRAGKVGGWGGKMEVGSSVFVRLEENGGREGGVEEGLGRQGGEGARTVQLLGDEADASAQQLSVQSAVYDGSR